MLHKPQNLALLLGFSTALIVLALLVLFPLSGPRTTPGLALLLGAPLLAGLLVFLLARYTISRFVHQKVKVIYQTIHELKRSKSPQSGIEPPAIDLDQVTQEVYEWAQQRSSEIEKLRERENFRREFIGNISHELKTPIFNIQGYLLTLLDGALDDPEINRKYLKRANKSVDRMINIIEDLEIISDLESSRVQLHPSDFDLAEVCREVFELVEDLRQKRNITLRFHPQAPKSLRVHADKAKIEQIVINLIANALKYGKEEGLVEIQFSDMDERVLVSISDNGMGIPQQDVERVFERFYRVDKSRSREAGGTGLGLAIVKHILDVHGQTIDVQSQEDVGSTFSFTLQKAK